MKEKTESQNKVYGYNHVCGLDCFKSVDSFGKLEYGVYLACCFVQFSHEVGVLFVYLVLWVDFSIGCTEKNEVVPVQPEQRY